MLADLDAAEGADIDVLGIGRAPMHADLAADDDAGIALPHQLQRDPVARVRAHSLTNDRSTAAIAEKPAGSNDQLAVRHSLANLLLRDVPGLHPRQYAD